MDFDRRKFLQIGSVSALALLSSGTVAAQSDPQGDIQADGPGFQEVAIYYGPRENRFKPDASFVDNRQYFGYIYADTNWNLSVLTQDMDSWQPLNAMNHVNVFDQSDLPDPTNGTHTLQDNTVYQFWGFVDSPYGIELGSATPLIGRHGASDGFIHTGGATAITGTDAGYFSRNLYTHAPGGTIFDITADTNTEMLVESVSYSDAAGIGNIANLGTIDGYRVPTWNSCNFEHFDSGLTFTGTTEKVFISSCPIREVSADNVVMMHFDSNFVGEIVDFANNYVKEVQSDTEVVRVDSNATISEVFQYRGITHDNTVTPDNILTGAAGAQVVGYQVAGSYPIANSVSLVSYTATNDTDTITINTQATSKTDAAAYEPLFIPTTAALTDRFDHDDNGTSTYQGKKTVYNNLQGTFSLSTGNNTNTIAVAWFADGNLLTGSATRAETSGRAGGIDTVMTVIGTCPKCVTGRQYDARVANLTSTDDITIGEYNANLQATM